VYALVLTMLALSSLEVRGLTTQSEQNSPSSRCRRMERYKAAAIGGCPSHREDGSDAGHAQVFARGPITGSPTVAVSPPAAEEVSVLRDT
jgi:hypothetical protein